MLGTGESDNVLLGAQSLNGHKAIDFGTDTGDDTGAPLLAKQLRVGHTHNCVILENDKVKCWGNNNTRQLGTGSGKYNIESWLVMEITKIIWEITYLILI